VKSKGQAGVKSCQKIHSPRGKAKAIVQNKIRRSKLGEQAKTGLRTGSMQIRGEKQEK